MDNNIDMNSLVKKAQAMIENDQIPDELKKMMNQISSSNNLNNSASISNLNNSSSSSSSVNSSQTMDISKLNKLVKSINSNSDDDISNLLNALKPYLRDYKKEKIDEYVKLIKIGKAAQLFDVLSGDNK